MKISPVARAFELAVAVATLAMVVQVLRPIPGNDKEDERVATQTVLGNAKQLSIGFAMYATDYDGRLPLASNWMDALDPYVKSNHSFYASVGQDPPTFFAFVEELSGVKIDDVMNRSDMVPLVFQSSSTEENAHGGLDMADRREDRGCAVGFLDGHARFKPRSWRPEPIVFDVTPNPEDTASD